MVQRLQVWVQVLCIYVAYTVYVVTAQSRSEDKSALLAFKHLISSNSDLLSTWARPADPCSDSWLGVSCNCSDLQPPLSASACASATSGSNDSVVLLDLGSSSIAFGRQLTGMLAPELGNIAYLQSLRLDGQDLQVKAGSWCCPLTWHADIHAPLVFGLFLNPLQLAIPTSNVPQVHINPLQKHLHVLHQRNSRYSLHIHVAYSITRLQHTSFQCACFTCHLTVTVCTCHRASCLYVWSIQCTPYTASH